MAALQVYPQLMKHVAIKVVELQDHVLGTYDRAISNFTKGEFERCVSPNVACYL